MLWYACNYLVCFVPNDDLGLFSSLSDFVLPQAAQLQQPFVLFLYDPEKIDEETVH